MEMNVVVDRGRSGAGRVAHSVRQLPPMERLGLRRKSRVERLRDAVDELPLVKIGVVAVATGVVVGLAYVARRKLFAAAAVVADAVEEVADTIEDAAEDLGDAARDRAAADGGE